MTRPCRPPLSRVSRRYGVAFALILLAPMVPAQATELIINDYKDVEAYFEKEGFTEESWRTRGAEFQFQGSWRNLGQ